jgi:RNA polymerase sigma-70 factor (ECF subfamily)
LDIPEWVSAFWSNLPNAGEHQTRADVTRALVAKLEQAQRAWPEVRVRLEEFAAHWARKVAKSTSPPLEIERFEVADLFLAFACAQGDNHALDGLHANKHWVEPAIARVNNDPVFVEDVWQQLLERILVPKDGAPARILDYGGLGPIDHWLRAAALRLALNQRRSIKRAPEVAATDILVELAASSRDPHAEILKGRHRKDVETALNNAMAELSHDERHLIKLHFVDGLSLNQIGAVYQAHKSTISRRLARAHQTVLTKTRVELEARLGVGGQELESLIQLMGSQVDLALDS